MDYQYFNTSNLSSYIKHSKRFNGNKQYNVGGEGEGGRGATLTIVLPTPKYLTPPQRALTLETETEEISDMFVWIIRTDWTDGYFLANIYTKIVLRNKLGYAC